MPTMRAVTEDQIQAEAGIDTSVELCLEFRDEQETTGETVSTIEVEAVAKDRSPEVNSEGQHVDVEQLVVAAEDQIEAEAETETVVQVEVNAVDRPYGPKPGS